jgi:uncharacterized membrane protein
MQSRWRSKGAWVATAAHIVFVLKTYVGYEIPKVDELVNLVLSVATVWGVFNDPTNPNGY